LWGDKPVKLAGRTDPGQGCQNSGSGTCRLPRLNANRPPRDSVKVAVKGGSLPPNLQKQRWQPLPPRCLPMSQDPNYIGRGKPTTDRPNATETALEPQLPRQDRRQTAVKVVARPAAKVR
jgi:hypothetical protein